jgi:uncharacterized protein YndB with AHSA1/START domain/DNA-binding transcriptional ArsR family regulator
MDAVFKALADPTRWRLLDRLRETDGQTLSALCVCLEMTTQSVTQHLDLLVHANLVTVVRRGRERLHYLNPVAIHEIQRRWISGFHQPRLQALSATRNQAVEYAMTARGAQTSAAYVATRVPTYLYVTYIRASAQQVWDALTNSDLGARYWGNAAVSDWQVGSDWELRGADEASVVKVVGQLLETEPPAKLVVTFEDTAHAQPPRAPSVVTFLIEPHMDIVRLTVTREDLGDTEQFGGISRGRPAVLANLKSLLETGDVLPQAPWEMARVHSDHV